PFRESARSGLPSLSLHDALPISPVPGPAAQPEVGGGHHLHLDRAGVALPGGGDGPVQPPDRRLVDGGSYGDGTGERCVEDGPRPDRKSTRLNSSHVKISYAVFCL